MRARFTAYARVLPQYLLDSRHESTRAKRSLSELEASCRSAEWLSLTILDTERGQAEDSEGFVEFRADFKKDGETRFTQERSRFLREGGLWYFVSSEFKNDDA